MVVVVWWLYVCVRGGEMRGNEVMGGGEIKRTMLCVLRLILCAVPRCDSSTGFSDAPFERDSTDCPPSVRPSEGGAAGTTGVCHMLCCLLCKKSAWGLP